VLVVVALNASAWLFWRQRQEHRYDPEIRAAAARYGVAPALVKAVVWKESRFSPHARGKAGELGLMQLMDAAAFEWAGSQRLTHFTHEHVLNPATNTLAGTYYLGKVLRRYTRTDNPLPYGLADYNAGRARVLRWMAGAAATNSAAFLAQVDIASTRAYIAEVSERYRHYHASFR
jgi:soluble lytic murein transglycosylase